MNHNFLDTEIRDNTEQNDNDTNIEEEKKFDQDQLSPQNLKYFILMATSMTAGNIMTSDMGMKTINSAVTLSNPIAVAGVGAIAATTAASLCSSISSVKKGMLLS